MLNGHWDVPSVNNNMDTIEITQKDISMQPTEPKPLYLPAGSARCMQMNWIDNGDGNGVVVVLKSMVAAVWATKLVVPVIGTYRADKYCRHYVAAIAAMD